MTVKPAALVILASYDGESVPEVGDVYRLAEILKDAQRGDIQIDVRRLQAIDAGGDLVDVEFAVTGGHKYDEDDMAYPQVAVTLPDGTVESAYYRIDGRA